MTTMLRQEATVDDTVAGRDAAEPDISGGTRDRPRRDPVPRRESRIGRGPLDPGRPSPSPGSGAGRRAWRELAACQGMDSSRFLGPERDQATAGAARIAVAKRVCAGCSVVPDCRAFALHTGGPTGLGWALRVRARRNVGVNSRVQLTESAPRPTARAHRPSVRSCGHVRREHPSRRPRVARAGHHAATGALVALNCTSPMSPHRGCGGGLARAGRRAARPRVTGAGGRSPGAQATGRHRATIT